MLNTVRRLALAALFLTSPSVAAQDILETAPAVELPRIEVSAVPADAAIQERLGSIFEHIPGLEDVDVEVRSGVVTLHGTVPSARAGRDVRAMAQRTEGVLFVDDRLEAKVDLDARLRPATQRFLELGGDTLRMLPLGGVAAGVFALFWLAGRWLGNRSTLLRRLGLSDLGSLLARRIVRTVVTGAGLVVALDILDATAVVGALIGVAGVVGIALGFAFRNIVENYLAGVLLSARNPFEIKDLVQVGDFLGHVVRLTSRDTVLMTQEGNHLRIPNSMIITSAMTNFTRNPLRRFDFYVGVGNDVDLAAARQMGVQTLASVDGVLSEPKPLVQIAELSDSAVRLWFLAWIDQRTTDFLKARGEAIRHVKGAFDAAELDMPEPIYRVHLRDSRTGPDADDLAPKAGAKQRSSTGAPLQPADTTVDRTIDAQVTAELASSDEENLLK